MEGVEDIKKRNLHLLSTEEHLGMTCNCPLLVCGTKNKEQTSLKKEMAKTGELGWGGRDKDQIFAHSSSSSSVSSEVTLSSKLCPQVTLMGQADTALMGSNQHQVCGRGKIKFPQSPLDKESVI